ncbi:hypothetical protein [Bradyrhizobium yuanmingense]|uniref:Entry exclusion protein TrbK n=1 Tax=Bradyrhizobium yuanmingense TaxID=108015 RepID=A0ABV4GMC5_9BRAD|nr:hypothetical protein [Bradyrhizobium yuanmingense]
MFDKKQPRIGVGLWIVLALLAYGAYQVFFVGSPENKAFLQECYARENLSASSSDDRTRRVMADCKQQLFDFKKSR